ncbi:hypothetical protein HY733_00755 [Candidatus Uhrbacteria bacterium]|nr:hypothetical protein [Candidatus Uhrbacteria bacterium]
MSRNQLAIPAIIGLALGCEDGNNVDCTGDCSDTNTTTEVFSATFHNVAPYGWVGDHLVWPYNETSTGVDPICSSVNECNAELSEAGTRKVDVNGETFTCVPQQLVVGETDDDTELSVSDAWTGEGICGLAPDNYYSGWNVRTSIEDYLNGTDQVTIAMDSWAAVVTGESFTYENEEYLFEGTIAGDLSSINYYLGAPGTSGGDQTTLDLED